MSFKFFIILSTVFGDSFCFRDHGQLVTQFKSSIATRLFGNCFENFKLWEETILYKVTVIFIDQYDGIIEKGGYHLKKITSKVFLNEFLV